MLSSKIQNAATVIACSVVATIGILSQNQQAAARPVGLTTLSSFDDNAGLRAAAHPYFAAFLRFAVQSASESDRGRALGLYRQNALRTAGDYSNAALILGSSPKVGDTLLASELAMASLSMGAREAAPIAAWAHDRYLAAAGKPLRFGTLRKADGTLPTDGQVNDRLRRAMGLPSAVDATKLRRSSLGSARPDVARVAVAQ